MFQDGGEAPACQYFVDTSPSVQITMRPSFKEVTDALRLTAVELERVFGRPAQSIRQMRLPSDHPNYRPPPAGWKATLAALARERAGHLMRIASALESDRDP